MLLTRLGRLATVAVLSAALALTGCSSGSTPKTEQQAAPAPAPVAKKDFVLNIAVNADPPKLDPHQSSALVDRQVFQSLFDKLVDFDKDLKIIPMLAEKWDISADGLTYTLTLRKGVKFHDGTDFNADAVKYNFDRMMDPGFPSARKNEINSVDKVIVVDPNTVKLQLKQPNASLLSVLADRAGMMVSPTAAKAAGVDFLAKPVGTGPFKFKERVKGDSITLVRNDSYWQAGLPKAAGIVYKTVTDENVKLVNLQAGQLDIIDTVPAKQVPALATDARVKIAKGPSLQHQGLWLNTSKGPLADKRVRQAIDLAIDRAALVKVVFGDVAVPGWSPFAPGTPLGDSFPAPARDLDKAKKLMTEAGAAGAGNISLRVSPSPTNQQIAQVVQNMLAEANIKITIEQEEFGALLARLDAKNFDMAQVGWSGRPDPDGNIYSFLITGGNNNYSGYSNRKIDQLLNDARKPTDMAQRKPMYEEVIKIEHDDVPYVYLWHPLVVMGLGPTVQGFVTVPDGMIRTANLSK